MPSTFIKFPYMEQLELEKNLYKRNSKDYFECMWETIFEKLKYSYI